MAPGTGLQAQGKASGVKVEQTEGSPNGDVSGKQDVHTADAGEVKKEGDDKDQATGSPPQGEELMPDIASSNDATAGGTLHDQGIWEAENVVDPKASEASFEATSTAEANLRK